MNSRFKGYDRGSLLDLALLTGGNIDHVFSLCVENNMSLSDELIHGMEYCSTQTEEMNTVQLCRIQEENIKPATALSAADMTSCPYGGIGFMGIDMDFQVS